MSEEMKKIIQKLGFDPLNWTPKLSDHEDDSIESPFAKLTIEEMKAVGKYFDENRVKA